MKPTQDRDRREEPTAPDTSTATEAPTEPDALAKKPKSGGWFNMLIDFGPLLVFFVTFKMSQGDEGSLATVAAVQGTIAFMIAVIIAMALSRWKLGTISPMLWLSTILVVGFGGLTVYFHDERFIQLKPTIIYTAFAVLLLGGWWRGKALLKYLLQSAYDGLSEAGWLLLSRNWGLFFALLAASNEALRLLLDFEVWLTVKVWGMTALSFLFALSQIPLMIRHGLQIETSEDTASDREDKT